MQDEEDTGYERRSSVRQYEYICQHMCNSPAVVKISSLRRYSYRTDYSSNERLLCLHNSDTNRRKEGRKGSKELM
jgi:hypothetical protein